MMAHLREQIEASRAESDRRWRALPWYTRLVRTLYYWNWSIPYRVRRWLEDRLDP